MKKSEFKEAIRRGLGSAIIELQECNDKEHYRDLVLWACRNDTCLDMQVEGNRCWYLYNAIIAFGDSDFFENKLIEIYNRTNLRCHISEQISGILYYFASDGSVIARNALYAKYETFFKQAVDNKWDYDSRLEWLCVWLTSLDGYDTFKKIVNRINSCIVDKSEDYFSYDWFYANSQGKFGAKRVTSYLQKHCHEMFVTLTREFDHSTKRSAESLSVEEYIEYCKSYVEKKREYERNPKKGLTIESRAYAIFYAKTATEPELRIIAEAALAEKDTELQAALLWIFVRAVFPLDSSFAFELLESENSDVRYCAEKIICKLDSSLTHPYALLLINENKNLGFAVELLCKDYHPKDEALIFSVIKRLKVTNENWLDWHSAYSLVVEELCNSHKIPQTDILLYIYRNQLCSHCRALAVDAMKKHGLLTKQIISECLYDSYDDTREIAQKVINKEQNKLLH